ncbi:MAG TPA: hypothetical protein VHL57_07370, partial [Flavobacteriales bacterium]|nr:hypothetical protein [Flavobacteriales bacterium]
MRITLLFSALLLAPAFLHAQDFTCGNNDLTKMVSLHHNDPQRLAQIDAAIARSEADARSWSMEQRGGGESYVIPVVFHIIHNNGPENISDAQIIDQMRILNEDYNRLNPDWDNVRPEFQDIVAN